MALEGGVVSISTVFEFGNGVKVEIIVLGLNIESSVNGPMNGEE
jgi:hypothetical protein